ncbi:MAG: MFS transporter [Actinobacteria bacterium 13_2_20CM_2_71_6]|nr:MAG: MFS transporter [Actinobacteria bacterium 13_2_20CM_2_71_6]
MSGRSERGVGISRRALLVWAVGVFVYIVAVFHRSSLAVAGVTAQHRFGIGASVLALFSVAQLAMYAGMQIPVGVLLDRFGSRRLLMAGAALMAAGQLAFALASDVWLAIGARLLIGIGDAMTFISVLRLVALWFPPRRNPIFVQLTGVLGQLGSLASAVPVVVLLRDVGWTATYLGAAGLGLVAVGLVAVALRDSPRERAAPPVPPASRPGAAIRTAWSEPGTRLGLWTHFVTQFSGFVFGVLWGYPFLVDGEGLSPATAALLLSMLNLVLLVGGPVVGHLCGRLPYRRSVFVLAIVASSATAWTAVLLWPGRAPIWLLVILVVVLAVNGPGSMIAFDYARTFNPARRLGSASGIVNVGGFVASILLIIGIGVVLDLLSPAGTGHHPLSAFRWAFALQYLLWAVGAVQVIRYRNAARRRLAQRDPQALAAMRQGVVLVPAE